MAAVGVETALMPVCGLAVLAPVPVPVLAAVPVDGPDVAVALDVDVDVGVFAGCGVAGEVVAPVDSIWPRISPSG